MARSSKGGFGLYCLMHVPYIWKFKVGIYHWSSGVKSRTKSIDRAVFGFPIPIMIVPVVGAYHIEQEMHRIMRRWNTVFYRGDGKSEWFNIAPLFFTVPIMLSIWGVYLFVADLLFGTRILPTLARWFFFGAFDFVEYLCR